MKRYLDLLTNRITMYRLVLYLLIVLAIIADILAFFGVLQMDPFALQVSILVLIASCLAVNYAFAYMFSLRANSESALITAFILFFIFSPPESVGAMVVLAIIGAIAMASKYLLAWRGRHIFNPAAIAAVISGLAGLQYASWWVGTGSMMIATFLLGAVILYKTRRFTMGGLFMATSIAVTIGVSLTKGYGLDQVLPLLVTSWPIIFFSGFMLTEPLTQPPRNYQRYIYAVGIAVLASAQLQVAGVFITPEIALVAGNVFGFLCGQRAAIKLKLIGRRQLSRDQIEYTFEANRALHYLPGQYIELQLPHARADSRGMRRTFTIASAPSDRTIKIGVRHYQPSSSFKKALQTAPIGTVVKATGIYGDFILPKDEREKLFLVAGGIGITPFRAHLESLIKSGKARDGILLYSVRDKADAIYDDILMANEHGIRTYVITNPVDESTIGKYAPDIQERHVYVSGPPAMVDAVHEKAKRMGAPKVSKDHFNGY
jgi:ferredoxin-NADP reductase